MKPILSNSLAKVCALVILLLPTPAAFANFAFVHPGLLNSSADLARMKNAVATKAEPIESGFEVFRADPQSQLSYQMHGPLAMVGRNPTVGQNDYDLDSNAAYQCALMWCITGDKAYAEKSKEILNAWSGTLKSITGRDAVLMAGLGPFKMVNAAELLRYSDAGWSEADIQQTEKHFREVIYPVIKDFAPFANGNWDTAAIKTVMAIAVFCNDRPMFERALRYYVDGVGDGRLTHYIINETGQCQESGRDQQHTQLGLAHLGDCCEIAWHQGLDLYGYDNNLLLKGFEYTAKFNLGEDVPFVATLDRTGKYPHTQISAEGRGRFRAVFEEIFNHYANRRGIPAPCTQRVVEKIRPEGFGGQGADHIGFGTLMFARAVSDSDGASARTLGAPAAIVANRLPSGNSLTWVASVGAKSYSIKRASGNAGFQVIARDLAAPNFTDTKIKPGEINRYVVTASNPAGSSPDSLPVEVGLPKAWTNRDIGAVAVAGGANCEGGTFTLQGAGTGIGNGDDQCQFASVTTNRDCAVMARFVPQTGSQFSQLGLMMRANSAPDAPQISLLIGAQPNGQIEAPGWKVSLVTRESAGAAADVRSSSDNLAEPAVTNGRLTGYCWLKLERSGDSFVGSFSLDGKEWRRVGAETLGLPRRLSVGLCASSRLPAIATTVQFDNVAVNQPTSLAKPTAVDRIVSPDGKVAIGFSLEAEGVPSYHVEYEGKPIVLGSRLGLLPDFISGFAIVKTSVRSHHGQWSQVYGERRVVPDNYQELNVDLKQTSGRLLRVTLRAYNEGAAFRYFFPKQAAQEFRFSGERSEFHFPENTFGYEEQATEGEYQRVKVSEMQNWGERPLTLEYAGAFYACLGEADTENYPRLLLSPAPNARDTLMSALGGTTSNTAENPSVGDPAFTIRGGDATPWRFFVVGHKPGDLLERNYLVLNLNSPSRLKDISWIKPGKVMRDTTLTTSNSKAIMDLAAKTGLQYVLLDARWYGNDDALDSDATAARAPNLDIPEIIRYGREKNVGLILYVDRRQFKKQSDILLPLYEKWGVKGVKIGFVDVGPQTETAWITKMIQEAAKHHLMLNIHDGYRPTGYTRTYPNLMTVEGIRGNEHFPTPEHNCTLPFTRYVAGSADYTVCYFSKRLVTTHAHQLAMMVVSYSPLQSVFWYDRPEMIGDEPELEFFKHVPTVWDETKVVNGEIGQFATIARRSGEDWFVGTINSSEQRTLKIPLDFLKPGRQYTAHIYADDESVQTPTHVAAELQVVNSTAVLDVPLQAAGGQAIWLTPVLP